MSGPVAECVRADALARGYLASELGMRLSEPFCGYAMFDRDMRMVGAFVLNHFSGPDVSLTIACEAMIGIRAARFIADVAFHDLGCVRMSATTALGNERAQKALKQVGFVFEGVARRFFGDEDGLRFGLLKEEQKLVKAAR